MKDEEAQIIFEIRDFYIFFLLISDGSSGDRSGDHIHKNKHL